LDPMLIFFGMAAVTFFTRYAMIGLLGREMPPLLTRWLRYVPAAVLAALIAPAAVAPRGHLELGAQVGAMVLGTMVAWRTRNVVWTILAGMAALWLLRAWGS
jgi:branched-subunit amino acid transport protein